jgi:hypothetical protein
MLYFSSILLLKLYQMTQNINKQRQKTKSLVFDFFIDFNNDFIDDFLKSG